MTAVAHHEQATAWQLRSSWARHEQVRLTLTDRCMIRTVVGHVTRVSVTGALVMVDGWDIPTVEILGVGKPTREDHDIYHQAMVQVRRELDEPAKTAGAAA